MVRHSEARARLERSFSASHRVPDEPDGREVAPAELAQHHIAAVLVPLPHAHGVVAACRGAAHAQRCCSAHAGAPDNRCTVGRQLAGTFFVPVGPLVLAL